eukprot:Awhi_evm1s8075
MHSCTHAYIDITKCSAHGFAYVILLYREIITLVTRNRALSDALNPNKGNTFNSPSLAVDEELSTHHPMSDYLEQRHRKIKNTRNQKKLSVGGRDNNNSNSNHDDDATLASNSSILTTSESRT